MGKVLELDKLAVWLADRCLVQLSARVEPGRILTLMGPSGSGKSSVLAAIAGTISRDFTVCGDIVLGGQSLRGIATHKRGIGMVFQDPLLFPHLSVGENLAFGLRPRHPQRYERIAQALADIGMEGFFDRDPWTLSGGQAARVALQRCLLSEPRAILLDEPFSKLDQQLRDSIRRHSFEQILRRNIPAVLVTHDETDAVCAGSDVINIS